MARKATTAALEAEPEKETLADVVQRQAVLIGELERQAARTAEELEAVGQRAAAIAEERDAWREQALATKSAVDQVVKSHQSRLDGLNSDLAEAVRSADHFRAIADDLQLRLARAEGFIDHAMGGGRPGDPGPGSVWNLPVTDRGSAVNAKEGRRQDFADVRRPAR